MCCMLNSAAACLPGRQQCQRRLLAAAGHSLPRMHPIFRAASPSAWLRDQRRVAGALLAGPAAWSWTDRQLAPRTPFVDPEAVSPDLQTTAGRDHHHGLMVWDTRSGQQRTAVKLQGSQSGQLAFSSDSLLLGWLGLDAEASPTLRFWTHVSILDLRTLRVATCQSGFPDQDCVEEMPLFLPGTHTLLTSSRSDASSPAHLQAWTPAEDSRLSCEQCPVRPVTYPFSSWKLLCPGPGKVAFASAASTLCVWQPGTAPQQSSHPALAWEYAALAPHAVWAPDASLLLCNAPGRLTSMFWSATPELLAEQEVELRFPVWGLHGVLCQPEDGPLLFYAVVPGPGLQLLHRIAVPARYRGVPDFSWAPDWSAAACILTEDDMEAIHPHAVMILLCRPCLARPGGGRHSRRWLLPVPDMSSSSDPPAIAWLPDGSGVVLSSPTDDAYALQTLRLVQM